MSGDQIRLSNCMDQALRNLNQNLISGIMAQGVIDQLEAVKVQIQQSRCWWEGAD